MTAFPPLLRTLNGTSMGTRWAIKFAVPDGEPNGRMHDKPLLASIHAALDLIIRQMSTWEPDSILSCLNRAEPGWYQVPDALFHVIHQAVEVAQQTDGAYDPTVGKLVDLWGFGPAGAVIIPPTCGDIQAALAATGWQHTALNDEHRGVWQPGMLQFDLSSIAKGYGVDRIAQVLDDYGIGHYLVELGGELKARGLRPDGRPWTVAIEIPGTGDTIRVGLSNHAIATSGGYRRYFEHDGQRYGHTLDPRKGYPLSHRLISVSVIHKECMLADALATGLYCLGPLAGPAYAREQRISAVFMHQHPGDIAIEYTSGFNAPTLL